MSRYPFIDFHTHSEWNGPEILEVVSLDGSKLKAAQFYTIGYHPWWLTDILNEDQLLLLKERYHKDNFCLGIGECGLDGLKEASVTIQETGFLQQIELANQLNAPVIIHCVRAFDRILQMKKNYGRTTWAIHGFVRNKILAKQVLDSGCYLSVAPSHQMTSTFSSTLEFIPLDRMFIETDSDFRADIKKRYELFSQLRKCSTYELQRVIFSNFAKFYSEKWKYQVGWNEQNS